MTDDINALSDSILSSVKKLIGISDEDTSFDIDIILNINAAISTLFQLGVLQKSYTIASKDDLYGDLPIQKRKNFEDSDDIINQMKMYFVYKTRLGFDSTTLSGNMIETIKELIKEAEWRMKVAFNPENTFD